MSDIAKTQTPIKILVPITFVAMVAINSLANILPINGQNTGQVSDSYPNLFAPTGLTFSIWGVIYLLLAGYTLYYLGFFHKEKSQIKPEVLLKIGLLFSISSIANAVWIFSWHYHIIPLSMILMVVILDALIVINRAIAQSTLNGREKFFIRLPFSIYFGWITVATIANATTLLVSLNWNSFGLSQATWMVIILPVGAIIGIITMVKHKDMAYGLVLIWAYLGILLKHLSPSGFAGVYTEVITTLIICMGLLLLTEIYVLITKRKELKILNE